MIWYTIGRMVLVSVFAIPTVCWSCSVSRLTTSTELVTNADLIVLVKAVTYDKPPVDPMFRTNGVTDSVVKFQVLEVVRGKGPSELTLHGYLNQADDFNDQKPPYTFVRPGGRSGSCYANTYREGAIYLLFLKRSGETREFTVNWAALAPVNEQLHSNEDPWLLWVRKRTEELPK
jgi:hypothetical protein